MRIRFNPAKASALTRVSSALLAAWIFILSLAGVSPALHDWLHADTDSGCAHECSTTPEDSHGESHTEGHYCGVIALQGTDAPTTALALPERSDHQRIHFESGSEELRTHAPENRLQARAPPIEIVV